MVAVEVEFEVQVQMLKLSPVGVFCLAPPQRLSADRHDIHVRGHGRLQARIPASRRSNVNETYSSINSDVTNAKRQKQQV